MLQEEPYWEESYQFTRELALQREVEVEVETVDRGGTFLGTLRVTGGTKCALLHMQGIVGALG